MTDRPQAVEVVHIARLGRHLDDRDPGVGQIHTHLYEYDVFCIL